MPPRPVTEDDSSGVRRAYDQVAELYASRLPDTRAEAPLDLAMVDAFADAVRSADHGYVLDAGCGTGRMSRYLTARGCQVHGLDLSPHMIRVARREQPALQVTAGSLTHLPFLADRYCGVLLWYSIIHTPPTGLARVFAEVVRVLRPGGRVLVGFQSGSGTRDVSEGYRRLGHEIDIELERYLFTADEIAAQLRSAGLEETCRVVRRARGSERDAQAFLLAEAAPA